MKNIFKTSIKSTALATFLIWGLNINKWQLFEDFPFILLTVIPIWLVCYASIITTIVPFYQFEKSRLSSEQIFKKFFPYYTIACFVICITLIIYTNFERYTISFLTTAFFTATQSWIWLFKKENCTLKYEPKLLNNEVEL